MFRQVCVTEPSSFNATSGMHHRPIEGRHLVSIEAKFEYTKHETSNLFKVKKKIRILTQKQAFVTALLKIMIIKVLHLKLDTFFFFFFFFFTPEAIV